MKLTSILGVVAIALGGALSAVPAQAVMVKGQLDITGIVNVQTSSFTPGGTLDFDQGSLANIVALATDDFASFVTVGMTPTLFDLTFTAPASVYSVGGFTFTAINFFDFDNAFPRGFAANGIISGNGFDDTPGLLTLSTQSNNGRQVQASFSSSTTSAVPLPASVLMLFSALGGLGFISRRSATA